MATKGGERIFVDTNVLLSVSDRSRKEHEASLAFLKQGEEGQFRLFACGQVFREYAVVASRPVEVNGLGLSPKKVVENCVLFQSLVQVLDESAESLYTLQGLIRDYDLKGKRIHDANLVAVMHVNGLEKIKTWNPKDFEVFSTIECV